MAKKQKDVQSRNYVKYFWIVYTSLVLLIVLLFLSINWGMLGLVRSVEELAHNQNDFASEVYAQDGKVIGRYSYKSNRVYTEYADLPKHLIDALISTEDKRFYNHSGIDAIGVLRAIVKMGKGGGGSTISQQLAKNLFPRDRTLSKIGIVFQKLKEWIVAVKLERNYTKEEIVTMYLNTYDFIYQAVGIRMAAKIYFNKYPKDLNLNESATLVGMCKNPYIYNPKINMPQSIKRRNVVLHQMLKNGKISSDAYNRTKIQPIQLDFHRDDHKSGTGTYLRAYIRKLLTAKKPDKTKYKGWQSERYAEDSIQWATNPLYGWCNKNKKLNGKPYNIYEDGLKIYTTIDSRMQRYAEDALREHIGKKLQPFFDKESKDNPTRPFSKLTTMQINKIMNRAVKNSQHYRNLKNEGLSEKEINEKFKEKTKMTVFTWDGMQDTIMTPYDSIRYYKGILRGGFMAMDPRSGYVKAYVGGADYTHFMYDMVTMGKRQTGSTFKPFLYTVAMQEGMSPCKKVPNIQQTFVLDSGKSWTPRNSGTKRIGEYVTLKWGLTNSVNNITAWLLKQFSPEVIIEMARSMGVRSRMDPVPSLCLGVFDVSLKEMVAAYSTFANKGVYTEPLFVSSIEDKNGYVISEFHKNSKEVMSENTAYTMTQLLQNVVQNGTGSRLVYRYGVDAPWGGKTGTTNDNSDGWFMSVNPALVTGTWVGGEDRAVHFSRDSYGQGANMALPIFASFINKVYADKTLDFPRDYFKEPMGYDVVMDCDKLDKSDDEKLEDEINEELNKENDKTKEEDFDI